MIIPLLVCTMCLITGFSIGFDIGKKRSPIGEELAKIGNAVEGMATITIAPKTQLSERSPDLP